MSQKPLFVATHPRACSTAFERVFMTRRETLQTVHEPFGDAYYFGPERLHPRYENDPEARKASGHSDTTFKDVFDAIAKAGAEGKRPFIKDMAQYWIPPNNQPAQIAPSLASYKRGVGTDTPYPFNTQGEEGNPTVVPKDLLAKFQFAFLIRHPKYSVPSYYRCTIPPLDKLTGFYNFRPDEAGYSELRRLFDYLRSVGQVGPNLAGETHGQAATDGEASGVPITLIDADDLLDNPSGIIEAFCKGTGVKYEPDMLKWGDEKHQTYAKEVFAKWPGFHEDALDSDELRARTHKKEPKSDEQLFAEWTEKYGEEGAKVIRDTVAANVADYEYLKQFAIKLPVAN
ncbi:uncharacterized protein EI97DRAFT_313755 [Westerdykella ornata]|uniref:P-loop containing nucleoside triphosphate hydrolase protein n=1 Tax=Westerdykella ornata TaxID=318751 RepID=A0A6A6JQH7_WESOR|nr:uncharacterized protein EI97DRAFT_313755 [Westerdykella ornata]KAF2277219.1 hypothetical protein EI97DRAFT_313755 [Westerdykella ornata]